MFAINNDYMENDLLSVYENHYLNPQKSQVISEKTSTVEDDGDDTSESAPKATPSKKKKKPFDAGACYAEKNTFDSLYQTYMEEFSSGDAEFDSDDGADDSFDFNDDDDGMGSEDEQSFTLSELKAMTLGELADLVGGSGVADDDDVMGDDDDFSFEDDSIPTESYGHMGDGKHLGNQDTRDGKPKRQAPTTRVKGNGDADFSKQKTGFAPENTEGSEGEHLGNQDTRDGKPKRQAPTTRVKGNGDADFGKQNTGFGKKKGDRLF